MVGLPGQIVILVYVPGTVSARDRVQQAVGVVRISIGSGIWAGTEHFLGQPVSEREGLPGFRRRGFDYAQSILNRPDFRGYRANPARGFGFGSQPTPGRESPAV